MSGKLNLKNIKEAAVKDIVELQNKINLFKRGEIDEERFKHYRLTRGVYGQRQLGVQMFRIKLPAGKLTSEQLIRIADISEKYTNGNLHLTTRQNIQLHYVKLEDAPAIWTELAQKNITAREACGNTVRNLTASPMAGIDPDEPFNVVPYAEAAFSFFLRNPICQEMGRKIKPAFSSSDKDSAFTYFNDFGFIPRIQTLNGKEEKGFKVVIGGGLGAQAMIAYTAFEFLPANQIIPFMEAAIRVFDRHGEREKRFKARLKFLLKTIGPEAFLQLVEEERKALKNKVFNIKYKEIEIPPLSNNNLLQPENPVNPDKYNTWLATNVFEQKQKGFFGIQIRVPLGDLKADVARKLAALVPIYAADDIRLTLNQGILLRFLKKETLPNLFNALYEIGLAEPGFDTLADITACPGTDTCNLAVTNSTGLAKTLEYVVTEEYPEFVYEKNLKIKISGCMNACGQHMAANIGFHGSSIKKNALVIPAMQIVIGGGVDPSGKGFIAEKVIKIPTKKIPEALRYLLNDYDLNAEDNEYFNDYYYRQGKRYFYNLLKPLADTDALSEKDYFDWGTNQTYVQAIGVGECAGVSLDVVGTIIADAKEKTELAEESLLNDAFADSIYHSYSALVVGAKALLLSKDIKCNTHIGILNDFQTHYVDTGIFPLNVTFPDLVLQINKNDPSLSFASEYLAEALHFFHWVIEVRKVQLNGGDDKVVINNYYNA